MSSSGLTKYDLAIKHSFRRWGWKFLTQDDKHRPGEYFYLLGPEPYDWKVAKGLGVGRDRLIGVSTERSHVEMAKANGLWAIRAGLSDVIGDWRKPIAGVFADFECGWNYDAMDKFVHVCWRASAQQSFPIIVNMQRGRESRSDAETIAACRDVIGMDPSRIRQKLLLDLFTRVGVLPLEWCEFGDESLERTSTALYEILSKTSKRFSYRSRRVWMDAVGISGLFSVDLWPNLAPSVANYRVAALKALRTMRKVG